MWPRSLLLHGAVTEGELVTLAWVTAFEGAEAQLAEMFPDSVRIALGDWLSPGCAMRWLVHTDGKDGGTYHLAESGRVAVVDGLRYRAHSLR